MAFVYSAFQLFKGVCDISYRGILISDKISDYLSFILDQANDITSTSFNFTCTFIGDIILRNDHCLFLKIKMQMVAYLLISSSSVGIEAIRRAERASPLWKAAIISVSMSFAIFLAVATCALITGYTLCKRITW